MKKIYYIMFLLLLMISCRAKQEEWTLISSDNELCPYTTGYVNEKGDTVIPIGKYVYCFTEKFDKIAIVLPQNLKSYVAIDKKENVLFEVLVMENMPDDVKNGMFRIRQNNKTGFANMQGEIVIAPIYDAALPFKNGVAMVNMGCEIVKEDEHHDIRGGKWGLIDTKGNYIIEPNLEDWKEFKKKVDAVKAKKE